MNVNEKKLDQLIQKIIRHCDDCPLYNPNELCDYLKDRGVRCEDLLLKWLQEFDIEEALIEGAHIVNDQIIFPPEQIFSDFEEDEYIPPCDRNAECLPSCYYFSRKCPLNLPS